MADLGGDSTSRYDEFEDTGESMRPAAGRKIQGEAVTGSRSSTRRARKSSRGTSRPGIHGGVPRLRSPGREKPGAGRRSNQAVRVRAQKDQAEGFGFKPPKKVSPLIGIPTTNGEVKRATVDHAVATERLGHYQRSRWVPVLGDPQHVVLRLRHVVHVTARRPIRHCTCYAGQLPV